MLKMKTACVFIVLASIFCLWAKADSIYVFPESSQRLLSESEISEWNYDSLGIAYHEILARHGYHFNEPGEYYSYFAKQEWYQESEENNNEVYRQLSGIERENISRIKEYREQMLEKNDFNMRGKDIKSVLDRLKEESPYSGFQRVYLGASKTMEVYSGPGENYTRVAKGKAILSTNGDVYCAGYDGDWLMVLYENNDGIVRIGYVQYPVMETAVEVPRLSFGRENAVIISDCKMTDTPFPGREIIGNLRLCNGVTYLGSYETTEKWAYIEVAGRNTTVRGYIPYEAIHIFGSGELSYYLYNNSGKKVGISGYNGNAETLIIPDRIDGKEVIAIEEHAFSGNGFGRSAKFSKVVVPDGVVRIEKGAFANCENLVEVVLPKSLWFIRSAAFWKCRNLTKVDLPSNVKEIGNNAFAFCPNLGDLIIRSHRVEIEDLAFNSSNVRLVLHKGSPAEVYAQEKGIEYIYLSDYELK